MRVVHRAGAEAAFARSAQAAADHVEHVAFRIGDQHAMVTGVGDEKFPAAMRDLAGIEQGGLRLAACGWRPMERLRVRFLQQLRDETLEHGRVGLAGGDRRQRAVGPDDHQRRPGAHRVLRPDPHLAVDRHRMRHAVPPHRGEDVLAVLFGVELGRMHADHDQRIVPVALLEIVQDREHVHAVDAAVRPEIEHHHLPAQLLDRERPIGIQPRRGAGEIGGMDALAQGS